MVSVIQGLFPQGLSSIAARATAVQPRPASPRSVQQRTAATAPGALRATGNGSALAFPAHLQPLPATGGQPLPQNVRQKLEAFFRTSFADVRIHPHAQYVQALGAIAFTHGANIHFAPGQYDPATPHGQQTLGHELAHVVQQRARRVSNPFGNGIAIVEDRMLENEAHRAGAAAVQAMRHTPPVPRATVQRATHVVARPGAHPGVAQPMSWGAWGVLSAVGTGIVGAAAAATSFVAAPVITAGVTGAAIGFAASELYARLTESGGAPNVTVLAGEASFYDKGKIIGATNMAVSRVVNDAGKGHTLVAFEWLEPAQDGVKHRHQIYHFTGDQNGVLVDASWGGYGQMKYVSTSEKGFPKGMLDYKGEYTDSPKGNFDRNKVVTWDSYSKTWLVTREAGMKAIEKARGLMGKRLPFRLTPWLPSSSNCVQVANDILNEAGIYAPSPLQHATTIYTPRLESGLIKLPVKQE